MESGDLDKTAISLKEVVMGVKSTGLHFKKLAKNLENYFRSLNVRNRSMQAMSHPCRQQVFATIV